MEMMIQRTTRRDIEDLQTHWIQFTWRVTSLLRASAALFPVGRPVKLSYHVFGNLIRCATF